MKNYLAIFRRADFIDLYKYGFFFLDEGKTTPFDCDVSELGKQDGVYDTLFGRMNSFESSFSYVIIHYTKEENSKNWSRVCIEEVQHIFPLDHEAKREFEISFDKHIKIDKPIWDDAVSLLKKKQLFYSSIQGAKDIFEIFGLDDFDKCKNIITDEIVEEMLSRVYDDIRPQDDLPLWEYLMRYERHSHYPKNILGYFFDVAHIFANFSQKKEFDDIESSDIFKVLESIMNSTQKEDLLFNKIMNKLKDKPGANKFLEKIRENTSNLPEGIDFITTAVNYLKLRDIYADAFSYDKTFIDNCKHHFKDNFTLAAYMAGIAFTHDKFYSYLYEKQPLPIFKTATVQNTTTSNTSINPDPVCDNTEEKVATTEHEKCQNSETSKKSLSKIDYPITLKRLTSKGGLSKAKDSEKEIHNDAELQDFIRRQFKCNGPITLENLEEFLNSRKGKSHWMIDHTTLLLNQNQP